MSMFDRVFRNLLLVVLFGALLPWGADAAQRSFSTRFSANTNGDIYLIGNTAMTCNPGGYNGGTCGQAQSATAAGNCANGNSNLNNNCYTMMYTQSDLSKTQSSSATLSLPAGSTVLWAGLYWGGENGAGPGARDTVQLRTPASGYVTINASQDDYQSNVGCGNTCDRYGAFADVTSLVQAGGSGSYTAANILSDPDPPGTASSTYAGWSLVVVLQNNSLPLRNLTVFDGFAEVGCSSAATINIPVAGFLTPYTGPVNTILGVVAGEGDLGSTGDFFQLSSTALSDSTRGTVNFFESAVTNLGSYLTTKTPNYQNQLGWDIARISANNVLANGASSTNITLGTAAECYYSHAVSFMTDLYVPVIAPNVSKAATDVNGGYLLPGETLRFTINLGNTGYDTATKVVLTDNIPTWTTYKPKSLQVLSGANTGLWSDATDSDVAEYIPGNPGKVVFRLGTGANGTTGGTLLQNQFTSISFDVTVDANIPSGVNITNTASISNNGQTIASTTYSSATNPVQVVVLTPPTVTKSFSPNPVSVGSASTLKIDLVNPAANAATLLGVTFNDVYPAGLINDPGTPNPTITCTPGSTPGSLTGGAAGSGSIGMNGASILQNGKCTVTVQVRNTPALSQGNYLNSTGTVTTTNAGQSAGASATLSVGDPFLTTAFSPAIAVVNGTTPVYATFTITNPTASQLTGLAFTDNLPANVLVAAGTITNNCGGPVSAVAGSGVITLASGVLNASSSCQVSVPVKATAFGYFPNTVAGGVTSAQTPVGSASNTAYLTGLLPLSMTKSFFPSSVLPGITSQLKIIVSNPNGTTAANNSTLTGVSFSDNYNAPIATTLVNSNVPAPTIVCTPGSSAALTGGVALGKTIGISGGIFPPGGSCTITDNVSSPSAANIVNHTGTVAFSTAAATSEAAPEASATLNVSAKTPPTVTKSFSPASLAKGLTSTLTIQIANANLSGISGIAFTDYYPPGLVNVTPLSYTNSCGGTITAAAGSSSLALSGGGIAAPGSCTITVAVKSDVADQFNNTIPLVTTADAGTTSSTTATLNVLDPPVLSQVFSPDIFSGAGTSALTITITNPSTNAIPLTGVGFSDIFPTAPGAMRLANTTVTDTCGGAFSPLLVTNATSITYTGGTIPANSSCTITVNVSVPNTAGGYTNTINSVSSAFGGTNSTPALAYLTVGSPDINMSFSPASIGGGGTSTLTIALYNPTGSNMNNMVLQDELPAGMTVVGIPTAVNCNNGAATTTILANGNTAINVTNAQIPRSGTRTCTITAVVRAPYSATPYVDTIAMGDLSNGSTSNRVPASATLTTNAPIVVTKDFAPTSTAIGQASLLTITLENNNAVAATGVGFTDSYPGGVVNAAVPAVTNGCGGAYTAVAAGTSLQLTGGTIPANSSCTISVNVLSNSAKSSPPYNNTLNVGAVTSTTVSPQITAATATLQVLQPLAVAKSFSPGQIATNTVSRLSITLANNNAVDVTGVSVTDNYPAGLVNSATPGASTTCSGGGVVSAPTGGNVFSLSGATIPANTSCTISVDVTSAASAGTVLTNNSVAVTTANAGTGAGASATLTIGMPAPAVSKSFTPNQMVAGGTSLLTITIVNGNGSALNGVGFTDNYPPGLSNIGAASATGCGAPVVTANLNGSFLSVSGASIGAGGTCTIKVNVTAATVGGYSNTISSVTSSNAGTGGPATAPLMVLLAAPTASTGFVPATVGVNGASVLTVTLNNPNATAITGAGFLDSYPAGLFNTATPGASSTGCGTPTVTALPGGASLGLSGATIPANGSCTVTVSVVSALANAYANSTGQISSSNASTGSASPPVTLTVSGSTLSKSFNQGTIVTGQTSTLSFRIANGAGNPVQTGLAFTDTLPANVTLSGSATASQCGGTLSYDTSTLPHKVNFVGGTLTPVGTASCTINATVTSATVGSYSNVVGNIGNLAGGLSAAGIGATLTVIPPATLTKAFAPTTVVTGQPSALTFTVTNGSGNPAQTGLGFTDNFPANLVVASPLTVSSSCGGTVYKGGTLTPVSAGDSAITFSGGTMAGGAAPATCAVTIAVTSATAAPYDNGSANIPALSLTGGLVNGVSTQRLTVIPPATFNEAFAPATMNAFQNSVLTFTITNGSGNPAQSGLAFTDTLPGNLVIAAVPNVSTTCSGGSIYKTTLAPLTGGETAFSYSGGAMTAGTASCTVSVAVTSSVPGNYVNGTGNISNPGGGIAPVVGMSASLAVQAPNPALSKTFLTTPILTGQSSTLRFTITNGQGNLAQSGLGFIDTFPANMVVANPPNVSITSTPPGGCAGTVRGGTGLPVAAGDSTVTLASGTMANATSSCSINVDVTSATASGAPGYTNSKANGNLSGATGGLDITGAGAVLVVNNHATLTKAFGAGAIAAGTSTTLVFTITNGAGNPAQSGLAFTDTLSSANLTITGAAASQCGGNVSFTANSISLANGSLAAGFPNSCTVTATVTSTVPATYTNGFGQIGGLGGGLVNGVLTNQTLVVAADPTLKVNAFNLATIGMSSSSTLSFTITNNGAGTPTLGGIGFTANMPANLVISGAAASQCGGAVSFTANSLTLANATLAGANCTVSATVSSVSDSVYTIKSANLGSWAGGLAISAGNADQTLTVVAPTLSQAFSPGTIGQGSSQSSTITFTIANGGGNPAQSGLGFRETLPAGLSFTGAPASSCGGTVGYTGANVLNFSGGALAAGLPNSCTITTAVTSTSANVYTNGSANVDNLAGGLKNGLSNQLLTVVGTTLAKSFSPSTIVAGLTSTLTLTITNGSNDPAQGNLSFTDTLPTGVTLAFAPAALQCGGTVSGAAGGTTITLTGGVLGLSSHSCQISATVIGNSAGARLNDSGNITVPAGSPIDKSLASALLTVNAAASLKKAFAPASINTGDSSTLTFTITNGTGNPAQSGLAFTDSLPVNVTLSGAATAAQCGGTVSYDTSGSPHKINFVGGTLSTGSCVITATVTSAVTGNYTNDSGRISNAGGGLTYDGVNATLAVAAAQPTLSKSFSPTIIGVGQTSSMTFKFINGSGNPGQGGLGFTETLPAGGLAMSGLAATPQCGGLVSYDTVSVPNKVNFSGGTLAPNAASCDISTTVKGNAAGIYLNDSGRITSLVRTTSPAPNNSVNATLTVVGTALAKSFSPATIGTGQTSALIFTINNGAGAPFQSGLGFTETLPTNVFLSGSPTVSQCGGTVAYDTVSVPNKISFTGGTLASTVASCTVTATVTSSIANSYPNTGANLSNLVGGLSDDGVNATLLVLSPPTVTMSFGTSPIGIGGVSTLTITLGNANSTVITGTAFTDTFPNSPGQLTVAGTPVLTNSCGGTVTTPGNNSLVLSGGTIPVSGCSVSVNVSATVPGAYSNNSGTVTTTNAGTGASVAATLNVAAPTLTKAFGAPYIIAGDSTTLTFTIANGTGNPLQPAAISFTDTFLSSNLVILSAAGSQCGGTVSYSANAISLANGTLPLSSPSCTVTAIVTSSIPATYTNNAPQISGFGGGLINGVTNQSLEVIALPKITVVKTASPTTANPGQLVTYTAVITNIGSGVATSVVAMDKLSPYSAFSLDAYGLGLPFKFIDGAALSGVTMGVPVYSKDNGATWTYTPQSGGGGSPAGYDANITNWIIPMTGTMNSSFSAPFPSFTINYKVLVR